MIKKAGFTFVNDSTGQLRQKAEELANFIKRYGVESVILDLDGQLTEPLCALVVLGGDGTMLKAASFAANSTHNAPLLGINMGRLGFLTTAEKGYAETALDNFFNSRYEIDERFFIEGLCGNSSFCALNEICVKGDACRTAALYIEINGSLYGRGFVCDGVIVAAPTGSTAYNIAAGGPIIAPNCNVCVITLIAAHGSNARPLVISADDIVKIYANNDVHYQNLSAYADGRHVCALNEPLIIRKSNKTVQLIKTNGLSFYQTLDGKII